MAATQSALNVLRRAILLVSLPFGILAFVLPIYGKQLGASAFEIGGLFSIFFLVTVVARPIVGRGLDRFGRRAFLLAGIGCYAVAQGMFALAGQTLTLFLARAAQGLGSAFLWLSAYAIVADLAPRGERGASFGRVEQASALGAVYGAVAGFALLGFLGTRAGWTPLFGAYAALSVWALLLVWRRVPESYVRRSGVPAYNRLSGPLLRLMLVVGLTGAAHTAVGPLLMLYLQDRYSTDVSVLALAYLPAALAFSFLPSRLGRVSDRVGRKAPMTVGLLAGGLVSVLIPHLPGIGYLAVLWVFEAACFAAAIPAEEALVSDLAGEDVRGTAYGLYTAAATLGGVVGPVLGGYLYDARGHATPFYLNAALLGIAALLVVLIVQDKQSAAA